MCGPTYILLVEKSAGHVYSVYFSWLKVLTKAASILNLYNLAVTSIIDHDVAWGGVRVQKFQNLTGHATMQGVPSWPGGARGSSSSLLTHECLYASRITNKGSLYAHIMRMGENNKGKPRSAAIFRTPAEIVCFMAG